jgi:tricarballylate dehydrogenase
VVVVGAGNAAFCAAIAARERGASVIMLERAPREEAGGNTTFTAGAIRFAYRGLEDLQELMPDLTEQEIATTDFGTYPEEDFFDDMARMTDYRTDPDMCELLVRGSRETILWMCSKGIRFLPIYGRQAYKVDGKFTFWGGLTVETAGGGPGLIEAWTAAAESEDIEILYGCRATELIADDDGVKGVEARHEGKTIRIGANAVVLATGGFQANTEWRTRYLGPNWDLAKVRGTRYNTGDGIDMAIRIGASVCGNWSGCHAVGWEQNSPEFGDLAIGDAFQKHSYPLGIMINADGKRFVDEGADFRNYTYAKYGHEILAQPGQFAWQVFDSKVLYLLRDEYRIREVTKVTANTIEELVGRLDGVNAKGALATIEEFNNAVMTDVPFSPNVLDGRGTTGLDVPKTHWANLLDEPPYEAYAVTCGITFTFGGLRIDTGGQVLDIDYIPIPGLYAAGEMVGGLFYRNYPGGTGLMAGSVFGKIAGESAGEAATGAPA